MGRLDYLEFDEKQWDEREVYEHEIPAGEEYIETAEMLGKYRNPDNWNGLSIGCFESIVININAINDIEALVKYPNFNEFDDDLLQEALADLRKRGIVE